MREVDEIPFPLFYPRSKQHIFPSCKIRRSFYRISKNIFKTYLKYFLLQIARSFYWHRENLYGLVKSINSNTPHITYSSSYNLTPPISRVLIGRHLFFCSLMSPACCNSPWKCTPVKYKARQKAEFPIVT